MEFFISLVNLGVIITAWIKATVILRETLEEKRKIFLFNRTLHKILKENKVKV